ncbi:MAG TPA: non-heme iron oxygenase ferredoxin subunit [Candidatus Nanopelagicaceae bacterium]|nr:non-heme iron oxygenase ferredoxin subunit [Candidatus Nanopelagicaceae bacterium]
MRWTYACPLTELADEMPRQVVIENLAVCLVRIGSEVFAIRDECTHEAVPLSEGDVADGAIECWRHGSRFDLRTGDVLNPPAVRAVVTYPARINDGQVQVDLGV